MTVVPGTEGDTRIACCKPMYFVAYGSYREMCFNSGRIISLDYMFFIVYSFSVISCISVTHCLRTVHRAYSFVLRSILTSL